MRTKKEKSEAEKLFIEEQTSQTTALTKAFQEAEKADRFAFTKACIAGKLVVEAKEWHKQQAAKALTLKNWAEWFRANITDYAYRTADHYAACYLHQKATGKDFVSQAECLRDARLASKKTRFTPPTSSKPAPKPPTEGKVMADHVRKKMAEGEPIVTEDVSKVVKAVQRNAREDRAEEAADLRRTARPMPEGYEGKTPRLLPQGFGEVLLPQHIERLAKLFLDEQVGPLIGEVDGRVKEVIRALFLALIASTAEDADRFFLSDLAHMVFPGDQEILDHLNEDSEAYSDEQEFLDEDYEAYLAEEQPEEPGEQPEEPVAEEPGDQPEEPGEQPEEPVAEEPVKPSKKAAKSKTASKKTTKPKSRPTDKDGFRIVD